MSATVAIAHDRASVRVTGLIPVAEPDNQILEDTQRKKHIINNTVSPAVGVRTSCTGPGPGKITADHFSLITQTLAQLPPLFPDAMNRRLENDASPSQWGSSRYQNS